MSKQETTRKNTDISPDLIIFRLDDLKRGQDEFRREVNEKLKDFVTRGELNAVVQERNDKFQTIHEKIENGDKRITKVEGTKRLKDTITYVALGCSLIINMFTLYEFFK